MALDVLKAHAPSIGGTSAQIVLHDAKPLTDFTTQVNQAVASLQHLPHVISVQNPLPQPNASGGTTPIGALSKDGTIGYRPGGPRPARDKRTARRRPAPRPGGTTPAR
jgi:RND superfamily putative drug exporter